MVNLHGNSVACPELSNGGGSRECVLKKFELRTTPLAGIRAGKARVTATWQKQVSTLDLEVKDEVVLATKVQLEQAHGSTVAGLIDSTHTLKTTTEFADQTSFRSDQVSS